MRGLLLWRIATQTDSLDVQFRLSILIYILGICKILAKTLESAIP
jgi:hypothetical protein